MSYVSRRGLAQMARYKLDQESMKPDTKLHRLLAHVTLLDRIYEPSESESIYQTNKIPTFEEWINQQKAQMHGGNGYDTSPEQVEDSSSDSDSSDDESSEVSSCETEVVCVEDAAIYKNNNAAQSCPCLGISIKELVEYEWDEEGNEETLNESPHQPLDFTMEHEQPPVTPDFELEDPALAEFSEMLAPRRAPLRVRVSAVDHWSDCFEHGVALSIHGVGEVGVARVAINKINECYLSACLPAHADHASVITRQQPVLDEYDYIVVGGGTAGLTVADRLTESVLVIEYGYLDSSESILAVTTPDVSDAGPDEYPQATRIYNYTSVPQTALDGQRKSVRAGAVVGGSSAVNGMLFDRGAAEDYDAWVAAAGEYAEEYASEWGWENLLPWFKKSVTFHPPSKEVGATYGITHDTGAAYGGTTPIHASYRPFHWPVQLNDHQIELMFKAFQKIPGISSPKEAADGSKYGVVWCPNSMEATSHKRSYAKVVHYDNASKRDNYHLLPGHRVTQITMASANSTWEARGVQYTPRDGRVNIKSVKARKEVIVSAGTMHTPQVLERSGIGPRDILTAARVPVKVELPGVGFNFNSHTSFGLSYRFTKSVFPTEADLSRNRTLKRQARRQWDLNKTGPYATYVNSGVFLPFSVFSNQTQAIITKLENQVSTDYLPRGIHPTLIRGYDVQKQILISQLQSPKSAWMESLMWGSASFGAILLHIFSRGTVHISPDDDGVNTAPVIDYRAFTNPIDLDLNVELLKGARYLMGHKAMVNALGPIETSPGVTGDEQIKAWLRRNINPSVAHQVGTATLGPKELGGVVGPDLRVHGTHRLSVADNSIMPLVPGSHTSATAYAIGEKVS
ncbi:Dehydrogenase xptC [Paramyrothecium foliicola]|nr:Dehydrogenase xptC [Paramyrothecium foliicola]